MDERLLDAREVARFLHFSRATIYRMIKRGLLRAIRIGPHLRVSRAEVERLLREGEAGAFRPGSSRGEAARAGRKANGR